jgi:hypothetical protein
LFAAEVRVPATLYCPTPTLHERTATDSTLRQGRGCFAMT